MDKYSRSERLSIIRCIRQWKLLDDAQKKLNVRKNSSIYNAIQFLKRYANLDKHVRVADVTSYASEKRKEVHGEPLGDPPRSFEMLRKNRLPGEWHHFQYKRSKYVKYVPYLKEVLGNRILDEHKNDCFGERIISKKMEMANYRCQITGISSDNGKLAADHFIPKEKGGTSDEHNCVIMNKELNERKNNKSPVKWFCESILSNFLKLCKLTAVENYKQQLIKFIQEF